MMAWQTEVADAIAQLRLEADQHACVVSEPAASYVRHGYLLAIDLLDRRLAESSIEPLVKVGRQ